MIRELNSIFLLFSSFPLSKSTSCLIFLLFFSISSLGLLRSCFGYALVMLWSCFIRKTRQFHFCLEKSIPPCSHFTCLALLALLAAPKKVEILYLGSLI
jgi:hypothetical protein